MTNIPQDHLILTIKSRTLSDLTGGYFFEWHQLSNKLYLIKFEDGKALQKGELICEVKTPTEAKQAVAAYAKGFADGLDKKKEKLL